MIINSTTIVTMMAVLIGTVTVSFAVAFVVVVFAMTLVIRISSL